MKVSRSRVKYWCNDTYTVALLFAQAARACELSGNGWISAVDFVVTVEVNSFQADSVQA